MRILYITDALAVWGGIERVLRDKANYLVEHYGYDVHIVTTDQGPHPIPYPLDKRVKVHDLDIRFHHQYKYHGVIRLLKYRELNSLFLQRLKKAIIEISPDVIVCIRIEMLHTILKAKGNIALVCESHSMCYAYKFEKATFWYWLRFRSILRHVRKVDSVVALTEGDANDWRNYNSKVHVIPNVVQLNDTGKYSDLKSKIVLFVGRFTEQKDVWSLLKIWEQVHQRYPDWELHMYGEGEQKKDFENVIRKANLNIKVFPPTSRIFDKYLTSSMLVMTSVYEPFGLVLPEAMSCGLPVVAFNCPYGPADIITDGKNGFLVEPFCIKEFAGKICTLIDDFEKRRLMGMSSASSVSQYQDVQIMPKWKNLFEKIRES